MRFIKLKGDFGRLKQAGFIYIFGSSALNQMISFAYGIIIVRVISKPEYGVFVYANNIYSMLALLSGLGIASAVLQLGSENMDNKDFVSALFSYSYGFGLRFNLAIAILILIISFIIPLPIDGSNRLLMMMSFLPLLVIVKDIQFINLRVSLENRRFGIANTINALLTSGFTLLGAWLWSTNGIIYGQYLVAIIMIIMLTYHMRVPISIKKKFLSTHHKRELFRIAGISTVNNTLSHLLSLLGAFMLGIVVRNEGTIASYKVATTIPFALNFIPSSLMMFVYPYFAKHRRDAYWVRRNFVTLMIAVGFGNLAITIFGIAFANPLIRLIFGDQYLDAVPSFRVLMLSFFIGGTFRSVSGNLLVTQRKLKANLIIGVIGSVTTIGANLVLIPAFASIGAAYSHLLSMFITGAIATLTMGVTISRINADSDSLGIEKDLQE